MLTKKQERFCELIIQGLNQSDAYRGSYDYQKMLPKSVHEKASELMRDVKVAARIAELKSKIEEQYVWTMRDAIKETKEVLFRAKDENQHVVVLKAIDMLNKMHGFDEGQKLLDVTPQASNGILSFEEFAEKAGYPKPFEKQKEMRDFVLYEKDTRLLLGSRGYGKTDYCIILGISYNMYLEYMIKNLKTSHLLVMKSENRIKDVMLECRRVLELNDVPLETANVDALNIQGMIGKEPSLSGITIGSNAYRSRHPTIILMDDPVTPEDDGEAARVKAKKVFDEAMKLTSNVCLIGQPVHRYDLYNELRKKIKLLEVPHGTIPELDHDLEALKISGVSEDSIMLSYHLTIPEAGKIPFASLRYLDQMPEGETVAFIDPSHEGGDFTALTIMRAYGEGVAVQGYAWQRAWNHSLDLMLEPIQTFKVKRLCFETNALGDMPIDILRKALPNVGIVGRRTTTNKHARIMAAASLSNMIHLSNNSMKEYKNQIEKYEYNSAHDDAPDSLATCLEWLGLIKADSKKGLK